MENDPRKRRPNNAKGWAKGWSVKKSEAKALLAEGKWERDLEHSCTECDAHVSEQGELLLFMAHGRSVLYASLQELKEKEAEFKRAAHPAHVLEGLLPQGPSFIEAVPSLVDGLAKQLNIPRESLDRSFESLELVENALKKIRPRKKILEIPNLFASIIAYTGEAMRAITGGEWHLRELPNDIWEPWIHHEKMHYMNPFLEPYKDIHEMRRGGVMLRPLVSAETKAFVLAMGAAAGGVKA